ncbi:MAG: DUF2887 domain-containing protein, partial [Dolichospermum sp.]
FRKLVKRTSMKTDKLFYRIFLNQPGLIAELIPGIPEDCEFEYSAPVIKEKETRLDGLLVPVSNNNDNPDDSNFRKWRSPKSF